MKILHLITTIERGGAENQLLILTREQIRQGHHVTVLPLKGIPELEAEFISSGVTVDLQLLCKGFLFQLSKISQVKGFFDITHLHLPRAEILGTLSIKNGRVIVSKHNTEPFYPGANKFLSTLLARFVALRADKIIAISNAVSDYLYVNKEVSRRKQINVVLYGYDKQETSFQVSDEFAKIRKSTEHLLVTVSRLVPQKDLPTLIKAVSKLQEKWPDVQLVIYGVGPLLDELREFARKLAILPAIHFLGKTSNPKGAMSQGDIFVLTSKYEGFGLVIVEAMASAVPIVAANNSAIPEVLGSDHPLLFLTGEDDDLVNTINRVFSNSSLAGDIITHQTERLKQFEPNHMANRIFEVYNNATT